MNAHSAVTTGTKGMWVTEAGIRKFVTGRSAEEAAAEAAAAMMRPATDAVIHVDETTPLDDVNAMSLNPGATVLFKRGGVWLVSSVYRKTYGEVSETGVNSMIVAARGDALQIASLVC